MVYINLPWYKGAPTSSAHEADAEHKDSKGHQAWQWASSSWVWAGLRHFIFGCAGFKVHVLVWGGELCACANVFSRSLRKFTSSLVFSWLPVGTHVFGWLARARSLYLGPLAYDVGPWLINPFLLKGLILGSLYNPY